MRRHDDKHREMVAYSPLDLADLPRLPGAGREMSDAEITAAALDDPDTVHPAEDDAPFAGETGRDALAAIFPAETVDALLAPRRGRPKSERPKIQFTARFDAEIVEHFRSSGKGWQVRMEDALRKAIAMGL